MRNSSSLNFKLVLGLLGRVACWVGLVLLSPLFLMGSWASLWYGQKSFIISLGDVPVFWYDLNTLAS